MFLLSLPHGSLVEVLQPAQLFNHAVLNSSR